MVLVENPPKKVKKYSLREPIHVNSQVERDRILSEYSDYVFACKDAGITPKPPPLVGLSSEAVPCARKFPETGCSSEKLFRCGEIWERYTFYNEEMNRKRFAYGYAGNKKDSDPWKEATFQAFDELGEESVLEAFTEEFPEHETGMPLRETRPMTEEEREQERQRWKRRQKKQVQRYVNLNRLYFMYTLSFALEENENVKGLRFILPEENQRDRGEVEKVWNKRLTCIRRKLKCQGRGFKFLKVLEKHTGERARRRGRKPDPRKLGTYHIHFATDKELDKDELQHLWGYGVIWCDNFNKSKKQVNGKTVNVEREGAVNDPGRYMSKYMEKDFDDAEKHGYRRAYSPSQNLRKPKPDRDEELNQNMIDNPRLGFDKQEVSPELWKRICQLASAEKVKTFEETYPIEFIAREKTGEERTVKMFVKYEYFNFRTLLPNISKVKRKTEQHPGVDNHLPLV